MMGPDDYDKSDVDAAFARGVASERARWAARVRALPDETLWKLGQAFRVWPNRAVAYSAMRQVLIEALAEQEK
jgi:hypothetical protein